MEGAGSSRDLHLPWAVSPTSALAGDDPHQTHLAVNNPNAPPAASHAGFMGSQCSCRKIETLPT
jgi:hypothetical protein